MPFDFLDTLGKVSDVLDIFITIGNDFPSRDVDQYEKSADKKKTKHFTEKISAAFLLLAVFLFYIVFKDTLPQENFTQTIVVTSIIGIALSFVFFFILNVFELYYFKSISLLFLFSISSLLLSTAVVMAVYFKFLV